MSAYPTSVSTDLVNFVLWYSWSMADGRLKRKSRENLLDDKVYTRHQPRPITPVPDFWVFILQKWLISFFIDTQNI